MRTFSYVAVSTLALALCVADELVELHVDGADVHAGRERKTGAHFTVRVPVSDITRAHGAKAFVVVFSRRAVVHDETSWRVTEARVAFGQR